MKFLGEWVVGDVDRGEWSCGVGIVGDDVEIQGVVDEEAGPVGRNPYGPWIVSERDATAELDLGVIVVDGFTQEHVVGSREDDEKLLAICRDVNLPGIGSDEVAEK